ncbi:2-oxo acid dehydrogenase subunit E2 [Streptomyces sp. DSM 44915]|uniref:Dihydrolipoamide acetyltransferase component of pyruvate dehydrogenase complex n=1 Tax=Streptomyces chisholmiae TaxID=3075540 RepID=A0ABU2JNW1_9ACTN|nr:2-oxo acid dehydrogenase subunit E2 [Streptomyces sp. DSM 44915]MDT0266587.1 2-oxo acid dehydrogenase subunit E2 [Streptomyces sp. DSM 44915]
MSDLLVPRLNSNDDDYTLVEWLVAPAGAVTAGEPVALLETSKAATELVAEESGFLLPLLPAGRGCRPGTVVARVTATAAEAAGGPPDGPADGPATPAEPAEAGSGPVISRAARALMRRHDLTEEALAPLGRRVVREADVRRLLSGAEPAAPTTPAAAPATEAEPAAPSAEPAAHQRAVARTVTLAHRTVPAAFVAVRVLAAAVQDRQRELGARHRAHLGLPELVIGEIAGLLPEFPRCFATVTPVEADEPRLVPATHAHVGVTVDVGTGLSVPVVRDAARLGPLEISATLATYRLRARRRTLRPADLEGATISLSLQTEPGVVLARPIVFPGQTCTLVLCALQREVWLTPDGTPATRDFFHLGLSYDHRFVNGREAAAFLGAARDALERPHSLPEQPGGED